MKTLSATTLVFCLIVYRVSAQPAELKFAIDTSIQIMKYNAVNSGQVNWDKIRDSALTQAADKQNGYQLGPVFRFLLQSLHDYHGAVYCGDSTFKWYREEPENSDSIKNEWKKGVYVKTAILSGNIGYLRVPYMSFAERAELDKKAQNLNDSLCLLLDKNIKGIVLDLRLNAGGAMFPMMLGLKQLLGDGKIGSFESKNHESWLLKDNGFYLDTTMYTSIVPKCRIGNNNNIPVAVLIGPGTGSSGEFLAMSFKKRKNTVFIGLKTAGYVTSTQAFRINDALSLLLSTGYGRDRAGQLYDHALSPDIYIQGPDSFNHIQNDKSVLAALKWISLKN